MFGSTLEHSKTQEEVNFTKRLVLPSVVQFHILISFTAIK